MGKLCNIDQLDLAGFMLWLVKLGYIEKIMPDGNRTYKANGAHPRFLVVNADGTAGWQARKLYREYKDHLNAE